MSHIDFTELKRRLVDYAVYSTRDAADAPRLCADASEGIQILLDAVGSQMAALISVRDKLRIVYAKRQDKGIVTTLHGIALFDILSAAIAEIDAVAPSAPPPHKEADGK